jgi:ribosomal RNA-processing protein 1
MLSTGLTKGDMLKLWKGLFYCMWMSDKPKVQASNIVHIKIDQKLDLMYFGVIICYLM